MSWIKLDVINNRFFSSVATLKTTDNKFIDTINKVPINTIDILCVKI
ncbi:MAG: hypothetical protein RSD77_08645 [Romboutsia sp.]